MSAIASDTDSEQNLQSDPRRKVGYLVQSVVDGVGADAFGYFGELAQILRDLLRADDQVRDMRRLFAPEGRIGNALQFRRGFNRRAHHGYWYGQPPPDRRHDAKGNEEERQWRAQGDGPSASMSIGAHAVCAI